MNDFWGDYGIPFLIMLGQSVLLLVVLLVVIAYVLLADRKVWAAVQLRRGPNVVGPWGLLQSFADFLKYIVKEIVIPSGADKALFFLALSGAMDAVSSATRRCRPDTSWAEGCPQSAR